MRSNLISRLRSRLVHEPPHHVFRSVSPLFVLAVAAYVVGLLARWDYILVLHHPRNNVYTDAMPITALAEVLTDTSAQQRFFHTVWPPGMSAFLALNFAFDPTAGSAAICQLVASAVVPLLVARTAHIAYGQRAAWIALAMASLHVGFIHYGGFFLSGAMFQLAVAVAVWASVGTLASNEGSRASRIAGGVSCGLAWGLAFSMRPNALPVASFAAACLALRWLVRRRLGHHVGLAAAAVGLLLVLAPLAERCTDLVGNFCPGTSNGAMNVALGHAPDVAGLHFRPLSPEHVGGMDTWFPPALQPHGFRGTAEVEGSIYNSRRIVQWLVEQLRRDPMKFAVDSLGNAFDLFRLQYWPDDYGTVPTRRVTVLKQAFLLFVLFPGTVAWAVGLRRWLGRGRTSDVDVFFVTSLLGVFLLAAATLGEARYRIPFDTIFIVLAARAYAGSAAPTGSRRPLRGSTTATALLLAIVATLVVATADPRTVLAARLATSARTHRPARTATASVKLSQISDPQAEGTPWDDPGTLRFECGPTCPELRVDLEGELRAPWIEVSADHNDRWEVAFYREGRYVGRVAWGVFEEGKGLRVVKLAVPEEARAGGYDRLGVRPLYGDGKYAVGHVRFF